MRSRHFFILLSSQLAWSSCCFAAPPETSIIELETVVVEGQAPTKIGPMEGLQLNKEQIPGNVQSITSEEIRESMSTSLGDMMNSRLQSVNVNDYQGNPFQMDITYRGFSASPQIGSPQGLSVFLDGVRVNEPFGDVVNWDLIPMNALSGMDIFPGSNPLFGLNTLGGALALRTKNGFDDAGVNAGFQGGSWDRKKGELSAGWNNGKLGAFMAFTGFDEEGWRDNSPSQVMQGFARFDWREDKFSLRFSTLVVSNTLLGNGLIPTDLYKQHPEAVFTSPDSTENELQQYNLGGELFFNDEWSLTGQIYRRDSSRNSVAGDIYEDFRDMSGGLEDPLNTDGNTRTGQPICRYQDANLDGIPDYGLDVDFDGIIDSGTLNAPLNPGDENFLAEVPPMDPDCDQLSYTRVSNGPRNGAFGDQSNQRPDLSPSGWIDGTPIGVLSQTAIGQLTDGGSLQLNWNGNQHKFMVGGSIDSAHTDFDTSQRLGLIDATHRVYNDPSQIDPVFTAGREDIHNNAFAGQSTTFSGYFNETYSPWDNLHLSLAGRFNQTRVKNNMKARTRAGFQNLHEILDTNQFRPTVIVCPGTDPSSCPAAANYNIQANWMRDVFESQNPYYGIGKYSETPTSETFDYSSFNPSVGFSYLPFKELDVPYKDLNLFFNWSQGTRTPSSVELGCAFDGTLVPENPGDPNSPLAPKSFSTIGGSCTLPTTLSGDPFLPQIFANSYEFGLRGKVFGDWEWNAGVYRTDLKDDIYLVGITANRSFFDSIGDTRRQGIEFGFSGKAGIVDFRVNYGYTEATFQSPWIMLSPHNSSAENRVNSFFPSYGQDGRPLEPAVDMIQVNPGDRIPGVPLHNINATLNLHLTQQWEFGVTMVAHSSSFVRGNENNEHTQGAFNYREQSNLTGDGYVMVQGRQFKDAGTVPGYAIFNLKSRYEVFKGFSVFGLVNNIFDRRYASAGRLGINPFSPSELGTIGPSGWNYNSNDWQSSTLIGPGAPRAYWVGMEYRF
ncbi:MAG: TonB-dependent receptor [Methylococcaceae bacterium]|nr:TonB-dependent receptor [Methylococcaceae bacterium]